MQSNMSKIVLAVIVTAIIVSGGVYYWQQSKSAEEFSGKYENSKYGFTLNFPQNWGEIKEEVKNGSMGSKVNYHNFLLTSMADPQRYIKIQVLKNEDVDAPFVVDNPQTLITSDSIYSYFYSGAGDSAGKPGLEDQKYFDIQKEVKEISETFTLTPGVVTAPTSQKSQFATMAEYVKVAIDMKPVSAPAGLVQVKFGNSPVDVKLPKASVPMYVYTTQEIWNNSGMNDVVAFYLKTETPAFILEDTSAQKQEFWYGPFYGKLKSLVQ